MNKKQIAITHDLNFSRIVHGYWRLQDWDLSTQELEELINESIALGITTLDHADIYGDYDCEAIFGKALNNNHKLREQLQLVSKCGIKLLSDKFPNRKVKHYDYNYDYIVNSAENSLKNLRTEYLDVLLLHRPSPLLDPQEVAKAFTHLKQAGKVRYFGVSNFTSQQYSTLESYLEEPLVTNQIEISAACLEHVNNGNLDFLLEKRVHPMAWSPLAGGKLFNAQSEQYKYLLEVLTQVGEEHGIADVTVVLYAWLLKHPAGIIPIVGSGKLNRIKSAVNALELELSNQQWFAILEASLGNEVP